jgi:hypothetical protein
MSVASAIDFKNVSTEAFLADAEAQEVAILTMSNFVSGIPLDRIQIASIVPLESGRRLLRNDQRSLAAVIGSTVNYGITAVLEELGFDSTESEQCFDSLVVNFRG